MRWLFNITAGIALLASADAADDLPLKTPGTAMELELGLLPEFSGVADLHPAPRPAHSVARIEVSLDRAKKNAAAGDRMFRAGIIAKVDAEKRILKVVKLEADLAVARSDAAKLELESKRAEFDAGKVSQPQLDAARASADESSEAAAAAVAKRDRAELADAEINLSRQRRLLAAGAGSKSMVARAQSQLAALKTKTPAPAPERPTTGRRHEF
jgi:hypothetical protein